MKDLQELNSVELLNITGGGLSDFGEWLTDKISDGIVAYHDFVSALSTHDSGSRLESIAHG